MKAETQYTAILLMCGSPPPEAHRPSAFRTFEHRDVLLPLVHQRCWSDWAWSTRRYSLDNRFIHATEDWAWFLTEFLEWYDEQVTQCVSPKRGLA